MSETERLIERIYNSLNNTDTKNFLTNTISSSDLQSLLLDVFYNRSKRVSPSDVLASYTENRFCKKTEIPQKSFIDFDHIAYSVLPDHFEGIELSPVAPLGSVSSFARVHQNNVVSTIRGNEVLSDATNILTLEAALRRKILSSYERRQSVTNLATSSRVLRAQYFDAPVSFAHFRIFSLATASRDTGAYNFEKESLMVHLEYYLNLFEKLSGSGYRFGQIRVNLISLGKTEATIKNGLINSLTKKYPLYNFTSELADNEFSEYYQYLRFQIYITDKSEELLIVDGGFTDWTQKLLSDKKERLLISGLGTERVIYAFSKFRNI